jgi:hypothetical protein
MSRDRGKRDDEEGILEFDLTDCWTEVFANTVLFNFRDKTRFNYPVGVALTTSLQFFRLASY